MISHMSGTIMELSQLASEPRRILNKVLYTTRSMLLARTGAGQKPKGQTPSSAQEFKVPKAKSTSEKGMSEKESTESISQLSSSVTLSASMSETDFGFEYECSCEDGASKQQDECMADLRVGADNAEPQARLLASLCGAEADKELAIMFGAPGVAVHAAAVDALLLGLVDKEDADPCSDCEDAGASEGGDQGLGLAFVKSTGCPEVARYMEGIRRYKICGDHEYLMALGLTLRALDALRAASATNARTNAMVFGSADALRRLFLTSIAIACKYHHDNPFNSYSFGFLMGISARDMNVLEAALLSILGFNATPSLPHLCSAARLLTPSPSPLSLRPRSSSAN